MKREHAAWAFALFLLLSIGLLVGLNLPSRAEVPASSSFRHWLWAYRSPDLLVQVTLLFAGALGVAALLPRSEEDDA